MRRVEGLGLRSVRLRRGRAALSAASVMLGVAVVFGVAIGNASMDRAFTQLSTDTAGTADVVATPVGASDSSMAPEAAAQVASLPDVAAMAPTYAFIGGLRVGGPAPAPGESSARWSVEVVGANAADQALVPHAAIEGRLPAPDAQEIALAPPLAAGLGAILGNRLTVHTPSGLQEVVLVGLIAERGLARGNTTASVAVSSLEAARRWGGRLDGTSMLRLDLAEGIERDAWLERHERTIPGVTLAWPVSTLDVDRGALDAIQRGLQGSGGLALVVGAYLIYLTFSTSVAERKATYATLRALGASRRQVIRVVLAEAALLGAIGTAAGLALGLVAGRLITSVMVSLFDLTLAARVVPLSAVVTSTVVGLAAPVLAALVPARRAARTDVIPTLTATTAPPSRRWVRLAGPALLLAGTGLALSSQTGLGQLGLPLVLWGTILIVPLLLGPLARRLFPPLRRVAPGVGEVAALHVVNERSRSAYTAGLVTVTLAMVMAGAATHAALRPAFSEFLDRELAYDVAIVAAFEGRGGTLSPDAVDRVRQVPGVRAATPYWRATTTVLEPEGRDQLVLGIDPRSHFDVGGFVLRDGAKEEDVARALAAGGYALLAESVARSVGVAAGDTVTLTTAHGPRRFRVAATYSTFNFPVPVVVGDIDIRQSFNATAPTSVAVKLESDIAPTTSGAFALSAEQQRLRDLVGDVPGGMFLNFQKFERDEANATFNGIFSLFAATLAVGGVVGLLGLANTMIVSVLARTREIGVLRAIGLHRAEVRRMVVAEAATITAIAALLALGLGTLMGWLMVRGTDESLGVAVSFRYPWPWIGVLLVFAAVATIAASIAPARRAARVDPVVALRFE